MKSEFKTKKSLATQELVLMAAARCIARFGIERTTTREIAKMARVSNGCVAKYLPDRSKLMEQLIELLDRKAYEQIENPPENLPAFEKILAIARTNYEFFLRNPDFLHCYTLYFHFASWQKQVRERNTAAIKRAIVRFDFLIWEWTGGTDPVLAELIHNELQSSIVKYSMLNHGLSPDEYLEQGMNRIRRLLLLGKPIRQSKKKS